MTARKLLRALRQRAWLLAMDALALAGLFGSRPYLYAVERASAATDWGDDATETDGGPW